MDLDILESGGRVAINQNGVQLTFNNISYTVEDKKYKKKLVKWKKGIKDSDNNNTNISTQPKKDIQILNNVSGIIEQGSLVALMGPSGSGKSTLLDILAERKATGNITGDILVNGKEIGQAYKNYCSYVTQEDTLLQTSTVRETLRFSADLKLPHLTPQERNERVDYILNVIGLTERADTHIGGVLPGGIILKGLSGGQKKRVSIGAALVTNPSLIFLDEPTSGLDSSVALSIMRILLDLTKKGVTVVCSIHQPRSEIWALFNKVMVLVKGRMIYSGSDVIGYLEELGYPCPNNMNPADHCLDTAVELGESSRYNEICEKWREHWSSTASLEISLPPVLVDVPPSPGLFYQYKILLGRSYKDFIRNQGNFIARVGTSIVMGLLFGACFYGLSLQQIDLQKIAGVLFFLVSGVNLVPYACISLFLSGRALFNAERASKLYHSFPYFLATMTMEILVVFIVTVGFVGVTYALSHLRWSVARFFFSLLVFFFCHLLSDLVIVLIANITGTSDSTFAVASGVSVIFQLFSGFFVTIDQLPVAFGWLRFINPLFYSFLSVFINEFEDRELICPPVPPAGSTTLVYPCQYPNGDEFIKAFGLEDWSRGDGLAVTIGWTVFFFIASYLSLHYLNKEKR